MSKYNTAAQMRSRFANTTNVGGGSSFKVTDAKKELAGVVLNSMLNGDSFYQKEGSRTDQVFNLINQASKSERDARFAQKAMVYTRQVGNLRSVSHLMANALAENSKGTSGLRAAIRQTIVRPDDMTEMASLWFSRHPGVMLPNSMRRAFKDKLESGCWDAYQLNKYKGNNKRVKLTDIIQLAHPKDTKNLFGRLLNDDLYAPETLETKLAKGTSAAHSFAELLVENRLGYMAAVKNIRNALESGLSTYHLNKWAELITNTNRIRKSRMLPFRYVDAWLAVKDLNVDHFKLEIVKEAFNTAITISAINLDIGNATERLAIILDESTSMGGRDYSYYNRDKLVEGPWKKAITLAATLYTAYPSNKVVVYKFGSTCTKLDFSGKKPLDIILNTQFGGGSTLFEKPLELLTKSETYVDRIIMFTDMQLYGNQWGGRPIHAKNFDYYYTEYRKHVSPKVKFLFWNLEGHSSSTPLELNDKILFASGYSDRMLSVIPKIWDNPNALIEEIESVDL